MPYLSLLPSFDPKHRIIVCEGDSDERIINEILGEVTERIYTIDAGGKANLGNISAALHANKYKHIYVRDRDLDFDLAYAEKSFSNKNGKTVWKCYDIEGYLLYTDWLMKAFNNLKITSRKKLENLPADEREVDNTIKGIAKQMIIRYAGRSVLSRLRRQFHDVKNALQFPDPSSEQIFEEENDWLIYISNLRENVKASSLRMQSHIALEHAQISQDLAQSINSYTAWAGDMDTIRTTFSGKEIFKALGQKHGNFNGDILRDEAIKIARNYVLDIKNRGDLLRNDPRLGDFALLAEKALSDKTVL